MLRAAEEAPLLHEEDIIPVQEGGRMLPRIVRGVGCGCSCASWPSVLDMA